MEEKRGGMHRMSEDDLELAVGGITPDNLRVVKSYCPSCKKDADFILYQGARGTCKNCGTMKEI